MPLNKNQKIAVAVAIVLVFFIFFFRNSNQVQNTAQEENVGIIATTTPESL